MPEPTGDALAALYQELRSLAAQYLQRVDGAQTLQPTAIVHEAWLRLDRNKDLRWNSKSHFMAISASAMRNVLLDHLRSNRTRKRGGDMARITLTGPDRGSGDRGTGDHGGSEEQGTVDRGVGDQIDLQDLSDALDKLGELDERQGRIVEMRFFGGLTVPEVAAELGVSERTVKNDWRMAKAWLRAELE